MKRIHRFATAWLPLTLAACAPAGEEVPGAANDFTVEQTDVDPVTGVDRNVTYQPGAGPEPGPTAVPVPDVDPETGIDRNVIYEPQVGPEPKARPRDDEPGPASRR